MNGGKVLVTGGLDSTGKAIATAELYDPTNQSFTLTKGSLETARAFQTATLLKDGTVLVTGGTDGTSSLATAELYDPTTGVFSSTGNMANARQSHMATLLNDGTVLVTGGTNGAVLASAELYQ
jgi:WD40 repeat protein